MGADVNEPTTLAEGMLELAQAIEPMHEFLTGQVAYFVGQGFTPQESLAMAAAEFVTIFGSAIPRNLPEGWIL
jgi:hypothetical protein